MLHDPVRLANSGGSGGAPARGRLLVIDGDAAAPELLVRLLAPEGIEVTGARTAALGLRALFEERPQVVMLALELPDMHGANALQRIREMTDVPVMMLGEHDDEVAKASLLHAGADDYVRKPYGPAELVARIDALLRRSLAGKAPPPTSYSDGLVEVDYGSLEVKIAGTPAELTPLELRLLITFVDHPNEVLGVEDLLSRVWGDATLPRQRVKVYVAYLRDKFRRLGAELPIETVRGFGYRYRPPAAR